MATRKRSMSKKLTAALPDRLRTAKSRGLLILNFLDVDALPEDFAPFTSITELRLRGNKLTTLPPWVGALQSLVELDLAQNPITELPPVVLELKKLVELRVEDTKLRALPDEIGALTKLKRLYLDGTRIDALPASLARLKLTHLSLPEGVTAPAALAKAVERVAREQRILDG